MSHTVFYSWQSDRPPREGRNFIEKALQVAVAKITEDLKVEEAVREGLTVDKDTKNIPGSPPIFQTILDKIDRASVFLADLTICGECCDGGSTPNPNVLIEYGWALKSLGHHRILAVMNQAHGKPDANSLPFDLAQLRFPMTYNLPADATDLTRKVEREQLAKNLETALRGVIGSEEFKTAKLPKEPELDPFPQRVSLNGKARFRAPQQPLGFVRDPTARMLGSPAEIPIYLAEGPTLWLRLMPLYKPGRTWLNSELKGLALSLCTLALMRPTRGSGFLESEDGVGYYPIWDNNITYSVAYVFNTEEIWIIDASHAKVQKYLELDEAKFTGTLDSCAAFLGRLGSAKPYRWVVGMEGVKGRQLVIPPHAHRAFDSCLTDRIEQEGIYREGDSTQDLLRPFFEKVYDQCGAQRPRS
jgi:hypothetical protein